MTDPQAPRRGHEPAVPIDATDIVFVTPRIIGRHLGAHDLAALVAVYGDADAMRWVGDGQPLAREACARWIEVTQQNVRGRGYGMFALVERPPPPPPAAPSSAQPSSAPPPPAAPPFAPPSPVGAPLGHVIGFAGLVHPDGQAEPEVKYALRRSHWGRGLASEALAALVDHGHRVLGLDEIIATVAPANVASQRVLAKAGFTARAPRRDHDGSLTIVLGHRRATPPSAAADHITEFDPAQGADLVRMWRAAFEQGVRTIDTNPIENQLDFLRRELAPRHRLRVVLRGGAPAQIVGFMASTPQSVAQLFVRVGEHGQGIGTRLLELAKAESQGSLWLYTFARNVAACRFYERHGFREAERERPEQNMYRLEAIKYVWERAA